MLWERTRVRGLSLSKAVFTVHPKFDEGGNLNFFPTSKRDRYSDDRPLIFEACQDIGVMEKIPADDCFSF